MALEPGSYPSPPPSESEAAPSIAQPAASHERPGTKTRSVRPHCISKNEWELVSSITDDQTEEHWMSDRGADDDPTVEEVMPNLVADDDQPRSSADPTEEEVPPKPLTCYPTLGEALRLRNQSGMSLNEKLRLMKCEGEEPQFTDAEFKVCWDKMRQVVKSSPAPMRKYWEEMQHDQQKGKNKIKRQVLFAVMKNDWNFDRSVIVIVIVIVIVAVTVIVVVLVLVIAIVLVIVIVIVLVNNN